MDSVSKTLIAIGVVLIIAGLAWHMGWIQALRLGRLPGDILIERENMRFYFPLTTGIVLSIIGSFILWLLGR